MSKQDVIDYVMETPHNTNRAVLEGLVDTAVEESQVQADWDQNDPTAKDYIKNRICYYAEKEAAKNTGNTSALAGEKITKLRLTTNDGIYVPDSSREEIKNNIHLYYKGQRFKLKYKGYSGVSDTWEPIAIGDTLIIQLRHQQIITGTFFYVDITNLSNETININSGDIIVTYPDPVKIPNNLIPNASDEYIGGVRARVIASEDIDNTYNLWYSSSNVIVSEDGSLLSAHNITGGSSEVFTATLLSGMIAQNNGRTMIFGSADDTVSSLGLVKDDFPIIVTKYGTIYDSRPTFQYLIFTASGKKGTFDIRAGSESTSSPITWTFEGGGKSTFDIVLKYDDSINEYTPTQTWDEIKTALTKSDRYEDYALLVDGVYIGIERFYISRNNKGEVDGLSIQARNIYDFHDITDDNNNSIITKYRILSIDYEVHATKNKVTSKENLVAFQYNLQIWIGRDDTGALACYPENAVAYLLSNAKDNANITAVSDEGTYSYEGAEADSNATGNIPNVFYFSTIANGIYKRLKITQGQNGAADTVVMDKEIKLNDEPLVITLSNDRGKLYTNFNAETICNAAASGRRVLTNNGTVLVHYDIGGTANDKKYWILFAGSTNAQMASNGFVATEIYCNDVGGSFNGPWNQHYVSDLTNPLGLRNSQVGQIAEISGVDSNGKPTSWKTVNVLTTTNTAAFTPTADYHPATKKYVDDHAPSKTSELENDSNYITAAHVYDGILISSSTPNSTKKFKITVDDTGALTATGVTEA